MTKLTFTNRGTQSSDQSAVVLICKLSKLVSYLFIRQYTLKKRENNVYTDLIYKTFLNTNIKKIKKQPLHGFDLQNIFLKLKSKIKIR